MTRAPAITSLTSRTTTLAAAVPASDRTIPVDEPLASMLPDGGLHRGHVVGCGGPAAVSLAGAVVAGAARAGSWVLLLGVPTIGLEALDELGVPLHRVVAVEAGTGAAAWADRLAAAADGFELILTVAPRGAERVERKVRQRVRARGAAVVSVGGGVLGCDLTFTSGAPRWVGIGHGHGRLVAREVDVELSGRRVPKAVRRRLWLPGPDGRIRAADVASHGPAPTSEVAASAAPASELLVG